MKDPILVHPNQIDYDSEDVLLTYDGMIDLYGFVSPDGRYLAYQFHFYDKYSEFVFSKISDQEWIDLKSNKIPLYDLLFGGEKIYYCLYDWSDDENFCVVKKWIDPKSISNRFKPHKGVTLYPKGE